MRLLKRMIAVMVLLLMVPVCFPKLDVALADQLPAPKPKITEHEPKGRTTAEIESPKTSGGQWIWALVGVAAIGGIAAAAGSGGGSGDGGKNPTGATGSFESAW